MRPISMPKAPKRDVRAASISPPILPAELPRVMLESEWPARIVDGLDRTFPVEMLMPERRLSLFKLMQKQRAFRSEQEVPKLTPAARARLRSDAPLPTPVGSPLRPAFARGNSVPTRLPSLPEHEPLSHLQPLGGGNQQPAPIFSDPFAPIAEGSGGEEAAAIQLQTADGAETQIGIAGAAKNIGYPFPGRRAPTVYTDPFS